MPKPSDQKMYPATFSEDANARRWWSFDGLRPRLGGGVCLWVVAALLLVICGAKVELLPAVVQQLETNIVTAQGEALNHLLDVQELGTLGAQKFAPRRGIVEEIARLYMGTVRHRTGH